MAQSNEATIRMVQSALGGVGIQAGRDLNINYRPTIRFLGVVNIVILSMNIL